MKKKLLSVLLSTAMVASLLVGCGSSAATDDSAAADDSAATDAAAKVAVSNVNSACTFMLHQPKVPALPKRFQK